MKTKQQEITSVEQKKEVADEVLKDKKKEAGRLSREIAKNEQEIREIEAEMSKKHPLFIKAKEKVSHSQKKMASVNKNLESARKANEAHQNDIRALEKELQTIESLKKRFEDEISDESQKRGKNVNIEEGLVQEYDRLKQKAESTAIKYRSNLDSINREQKSDQDMLDSEINRKTGVEEQLKKINLQKEEAVKRKDKLMDHLKSSQLALDEQKRIQDELRKDVGSSKEKIAEKQREMENVREQLGDARIDKHEDSRRKKKQEVVESFKKQVPGVVSFLHNYSKVKT